MYKNALALAIGLLAADAAIAQNTLGRNTQATPRTVEQPAPAGSFPLTQSSSLAVTVGNSVSCNGGSPDFFHSENSYYRRFNLDGNFSATGTVTIDSVDIGIEQAVGNGGSQPITVNLYALPNASTMTLANLGAPIASAPVTVADQGATLLNVPIAASLNGLTHDLVVEVFTPDGETAGHSFFMGSNASGSINPAGAPSFIRAPTTGCDLNEPTPVGSIGFGSMHIVMVVNATSLPVSLQNYSID